MPTEAEQAMKGAGVDQDAILAQLDAAEEIGGDEVTEVVEGERSGKAEGAPAKEEQPESDVKPEEESEGDSVETQDEQDAEDPELTPEEQSALEEAIQALRRSGWETKDLDRLSAERVIALGRKARKSQSDVDSKLTEADKRIKELERSLEESKQAEPAEDDPPSVTRENFVKTVGLELGDEVGNAVADYISSEVGSIREALDELRGFVEHTNGTAIEGRVELARLRLRDRFPELSNPDTWNAVLEKVTAWAPSGHYTSADEAISDAARVLGLSDAEAESRREETKKETARKRNSQPTTKSRRAQPNRERSPDEQEDALLDELESTHGLT